MHKKKETDCWFKVPVDREQLQELKYILWCKNMTLKQWIDIQIKKSLTGEPLIL